MSSLKLFISREENFIGSALKIKRESPIKTEIIYIEDYIKNDDIFNINDNDIIYFLSNVKLIPKIIEKLSLINCFIFNKDFLENCYLKDEVQKILYENEINIPEIIPLEKIERDSFPLFCKEKKHTGITFQTYNEITLRSFFDKFEKKDFYLEKSIISNKKPSIETKIYYINGKIYLKDKEKIEIDDKLIDISLKISKCLNNMDVFSADVIKLLDEYYIIDVNPASGFYLSKNAREAWFEKMKEVRETVLFSI